MVATSAGEDTAVNNNNDGAEDDNIHGVSSSSEGVDGHEPRRQSVGTGVRRQNVSSLQLPSIPL